MATKTAAPVVQAPAINRAAIVDEFGALDAEITLFRPKLKRHEELRRQIQSWFKDSDPAQEFIERGCAYAVTIGKRANERFISNIKRVFKLLGAEKFLELCSIPLAAIDQHISPEDQKAVLKSGPTGSRTVKAVALPPQSGQVQ